MEKVMVSVPMEEFREGISAMTRVEALKAIVIGSEYSVSRKIIADILGFKLPEKDEE